MTIFYPFLFLCLSVSALAQIASHGSCPEVASMPEFDISQFLGRWFEMEQYFVPTANHVQCVTYDWAINENGTTTRVETVLSLLTGIGVTTLAVMKVPNSGEPGRMRQKYVWSPLEADYLILATDYDSYAVAYNCINVNSMHNKFAWILTRDEDPSDSVMGDVADVIAKYKLNRSSFTKTRHDDCERRRNELYPSNSVTWEFIGVVLNVLLSLLSEYI